MPAPVAALPRDKHDRPIPWFVDRDEDGVPDFRVVRYGGIRDALRFDWCWVCGRPRGRHAAFVIGPMCVINRVSAEPPSHLDCAVYSARACPFLSTPGMRRRERGLPPDRVDPAGVMIERNPGVAAVWSSRTWNPFRAPTPDGHVGLLFNIGEPTGLTWWAQGREATAEEVAASVASGLPALEEAAAVDGERGRLALARQVAQAQPLMPR